jgi:ribosomal protein L40E
MIEVYTHEMPNDTYEDVMLAFGIDVRDKKQQQEIEQALRGKICPHCNMENLPNAQFCRECKFVLTVEAFNQTKEEAEESKKEIAKLKDGQAALQRTLLSLFRVMIGQSDTLRVDMGEEEYLDPETRDSLKHLWEKQQRQ